MSDCLKSAFQARLDKVDHTGSCGNFYLTSETKEFHMKLCKINLMNCSSMRKPNGELIVA